MGKHAYLIMAHNQFGLLEKLLSCLDHERNDIFLHIDKKTSGDFSYLSGIVKKSNLYFTDRVKVNWGGYSQIEAELVLLEKSVNTGHYDYYHLLTGVDLPLVDQNTILNFFDQFKNMEFISIDDCSKEEMDKLKERIRYYHWHQELLGERFIGKAVRKTILTVQRRLKTNRCKDNDVYGYGSAYFDITDEFARYVVEHKAGIRKKYRNTRCADEMFLQTLYLNSPTAAVHTRYISPNHGHKYIGDMNQDVMRAIDWTRGIPYVYQDDDYDMLMESGCLFARKFDYEKYPGIVERIHQKVMENG